MTDPFTSVDDALDLLVPPFGDDGGGWEQILAEVSAQPTRSNRRTPSPRASGRRFMLPALVFAAAVVIVASAIAATGTNPFSAFRDWLSGKPGRPAPAAAQKQFSASPGQHSWEAFPTGTKLRLLVSGEAGGTLYTLYGFRSGNALCLTLNGDATRSSYRPGCVSASTLEQLNAPLLAVGNAGAGFGGSRAPRPEVSFGIVADGVTAVLVNATDGTHSAWLGGDTYLWVEDSPNSGNTVLSFTAVSHDARTFVAAPPPPSFPALAAPLPAPRGPSRIQATIPDPTIGWLNRHQDIGLAPNQLTISPIIRQLIAESGFTRFIKPDPLSNVIVGVSARRLFYNGGLWGGSNGPYFNKLPIHLFYPPAQSSQEFVTLTGVAADGVTQIRIFLADGEVQDAALKDNVFTALIPRSAPVRVVAYNSRSLVVGIQTIKHLTLLYGPTVPTAATRNLKPVVTVRGPYGATATLAAGETIANARCWKASFSNGQIQSGCQQVTPTGADVGAAAIGLLGGVQPVGRDVFILASTRAPITEAQLRFSDGRTLTARPINGLVAFAIPHNHLSTQEQDAVLVAYGSHGQQITRITYQHGHETSTQPLFDQILKHIHNRALRDRLRARFSRFLATTVYFRANSA